MTPTLAAYTTGAVLAQGGSTVVLRAHDAAGRPFAIKTLAPGAPEDAAERLRAEGELLARARGRGVIALHAAHPGALVLELAPGGSLAERLRTGSVPRAEAVRIFRRVARTVLRLHARGVVHRDVKPGNILFASDGSPRLADFGVAARIGARGTLGDAWEELRVGTAPYAAPELRSPPLPPADPAADVYALAVLWGEMFGGAPPREITRALHPDPARRPASVAVLLSATPSEHEPRTFAVLLVVVLVLLLSIIFAPPG